MTKIMFTVVLAIFSFAVAETQLEEKLNYCTSLTDDIQRLVCYDDVQENLNQLPQPTTVIPNGILEIIKQNAAEEWPNDYEMQAYEIGKQSEGYLEVANLDYIQDVPNETLIQIKQQAIKEWSNDYSMQIYETNQQVEAYLEIFRVSEVVSVPANIIETIKVDAANEWPNDYSMQIYTINNQIEAYRKTQ